jgi:tape measure domain-containing protein
LALPPVSIGGSGGTTEVGIHVTYVDEQVINGVNRTEEQLRSAFSRMSSSTSLFTTELGRIDRILTYMATFTVVRLVQKFIELAASMQQTAALMVTMEGSIQGANDELDRMITLSSKVPFSLEQLTKSFLQLKAAGLEPISDSQGNGLLRNVADAVAAFGGSTEQLNSATLAINQMAGKGVVALEELRKQLGQAVPSSIRILAEQFHESVPKLLSDITKGSVDAQTAIAALSKGFEEHYHGIAEIVKQSTLTGAFQNIKTQIDSIALEVGRSGGLNAITALFNALADGLHGISKAFTADGVNSAMEQFFGFIRSNADYIARFISTLEQFLQVLGSMGAIIVNILAQLPPEAVSMGIIGFIFLGPRGALLGAVVGQFMPIIAAIARLTAGFIKATNDTVGAYGLIGFLLMGPKGLVLGVVAGFVTEVLKWFQQTTQGLVDFVLKLVLTAAKLIGDFGATVSNPIKAVGDAWAAAGAQVSAFEKNLDSLRSKNNAKAMSFMGVQTTSSSDVNGAIDGWQKYIQQVQDAQAKLAEFRQKELADQKGLSQAQLSQYTELLKKMQEAQDRATKDTEGPVQAYLKEQGRYLTQFQGMIDSVKKSEADALGKGDVKGAGEYASTLQTLTQQYKTFAGAVQTAARAEQAKIDQRLSDKAKRADEKFRNALSEEIKKITDWHDAIDKMGTDLDKAEGKFGGNQFVEAITSAKDQFAPYVKQIDDMRAAVKNLSIEEGARNEILSELDDLQKRVNVDVGKAVDLAKLKAQYDIEDQQRTANNAIRDLQQNLKTSKDVAGGNNIAQRVDDLQSQWNSVRDGIDTQIREYQRQIESEPDNVNNVFLKGKLNDLDKTKKAYDNYFKYMMSNQYLLNKATQDLWIQTGQIVRGSIEDGLTAIVTGTGSIKDVIISMYNAITKAAIQYLLQVIIIKALMNSGNPYLQAFGSFLQGSMGPIPGSSMGIGGGGGSFQLPAYGGMAAANGAVVSRGRNFGVGGAFTNSIVTGPTSFSRDQMGEAGPEGILPLTNVGGKLGVHASGAGGDTYHVTIHAVDASSIRKMLLSNGDIIVQALKGQGKLNNNFGRSN